MPARAVIGTVRNEFGEALAYSWTGDDGDALVVIAHGLASDKDRPWSLALAEGFAAVGIPSLRLAFAGNGASAGRFEDANITKEVADLGAVLDALGDRRVAYIGHSMGGAVGVLRAVRDPRIRVLVSLAGVAHTAAFVDRLFGHLRPGVDVMLDKPHCPLTQQFLDDLRAIGTVTTRAADVAVPWLLVHGTEDRIVPPQDSRDMIAAAAAAPKCVELRGADHSFTGPWTATMVDVVVPWVRGVLLG